jgi:hypothetical protein
MDPPMTPAVKDTRAILKHEASVFLVGSSLRSHLNGPVEVTYTVSAYWTPTHFYTGSDRDAAEKAFEQAVARAPERVAKAT